MMRIQVAVSNRHAHLTAKDARALGINPKPVKWLEIGDNYASDTCVTSRGQRFRVLLPFRKYSQVEILASDCRGLGVEACYRNSGNLKGAPLLEFEGGVRIPTIVALPHVHVPEFWVQRETVVDLHGSKSISLRVMMWPTPGCLSPVLHIDRDEALAFAAGEASVEARLPFQARPLMALAMA